MSEVKAWQRPLLVRLLSDYSLSNIQGSALSSRSLNYLKNIHLLLGHSQIACQIPQNCSDIYSLAVQTNRNLRYSTIVRQTHLRPSSTLTSLTLARTSTFHSETSAVSTPYRRSPSLLPAPSHSNVPYRCW